MPPLGCRTVICTLLFVVLRAGTVRVSSVTEAAVLMNAVEVKLGGLAQPGYFVIEFANNVLVTTSVLLNSAGAPCQAGGVGRPAVGQPVLNVTPPIVLFRVAPGWWPTRREVHVLLLCLTFTLKPWDQQYPVLSQAGLLVAQWAGRPGGVSPIGWPGGARAGVAGAGGRVVIIVAMLI